MCKLTEKYTKKKEFWGWKIVAVKDNRYYSPAIGIKYENDKPIKRPKQQMRIVDNYVDYILQEGTEVFSAEMVGRTAVFENERHAARELDGFTLQIFKK